MQIRIYRRRKLWGHLARPSRVRLPTSPHGSLVPSSGVPSLSCVPFCSCVLSIILSWDEDGCRKFFGSIGEMTIFVIPAAEMR